MEAAALAIQEASESVAAGMVWAEYIAERKPYWLPDHEQVMHPGGAVRSRSSELTVPGALALLATIRLIDLTPERVEEWATLEAEKRPTRARLSLRLLKAFLFGAAVTPPIRQSLRPTPREAKKLVKAWVNPSLKTMC